MSKYFDKQHGQNCNCNECKMKNKKASEGKSAESYKKETTHNQHKHEYKK